MALSDIVLASPEIRDADSNPEVTWIGNDRKDGIVG